MTLPDEYSIPQLNRLLTVSKWALGFFAVFTALAGLFNQYVSDRIARLQTLERNVAEDRLKSAETSSRDANARAKAAEDAAGTANRDAEEARKRAETIEAKLAPRVLSAAQIRSLEAGFALARAEGRATAGIIVASKMFDAEAQQLADAISQTIVAGGWDTRASKTAVVTFSGIRVVYYGEQAAAACESVRNIFRNAGIEIGTDIVSINFCGDQTQPAIYIWVGEK